LALCLAIGIYPKPLIDFVKPDVQAIARLYDARRLEQNSQPMALSESMAAPMTGEVRR
jgi:hypothetical protein